MKVFFCAIMVLLLLPAGAKGNFLTDTEQLSAEGAQFTWQEARSKSLRITIDYRDEEGNLKRSNLGSGFLISSDGLFVTAYHVMKYCLIKQKDRSRFSANVDCSSENPGLRYLAHNGGREFDIELVSYLTERDSTNGKEVHTPDETLKHRDFVIGRLKAGPNAQFSYWNLRDFKEGTANPVDPRANFELKPLIPPKKIFIAGYPGDRDFVLAHGFLNLTEDMRRGYFAANLDVYEPAYLETLGISRDTKWGLRIENHMSGGPVIDSFGSVVGIVVNGDHSTAGILSIENVLETFFSRSAKNGSPQALVLSPTETPLYLRDDSPRNPENKLPLIDPEARSHSPRS